MNREYAADARAMKRDVMTTRAAAQLQPHGRIAPARVSGWAAVLFGLVIVLACVGCGPRFAVLPGYLRGAGWAVANDIRVVATAEPPGRPCECRDVLVLQVAIQNGSSGPLAVRYDEFTVRAAGKRLAALPPFDLASNERPSLPARYSYPWSGFQLAPHLARYYRGFWRATFNVEQDPAYYERHYPELTAAATITDAMRRQALPEGVLEPDGYITGVLYFAAPGADPSTLTARFADPRSGRELAAFAVPLTADR